MQKGGDRHRSDGMEIGPALGFSVSLCGIMPFAPIQPLD